MPKVRIIDPTEVRKPGFVEFQPIPVNQYQKSVREEKEHFTTEEFRSIYHDMVLIREFETMLNLIKIKGEYNGTPYNHPGPAHLSIGQESAAVGMAWTLTVDDFIFGSHRSHGEILAKGMSAIHKLDDGQLTTIMESFFDGAVYKIVKKDFSGSVKELAKRFLVYGTLAEIFARKTGFNRGLGGSMHAFFTPFGVYPNNAIVGGSGDIAVGAALYKKVNRKPGLVVANIGDASMACGPVWEGINFAAMDQFRELWEGEMQGGLPVIINIMNNQYGMGGQTAGETMGYGIAARIGAGVNADQMHAERVDGYNPLAVIDAYRRNRKVIEEKRGPVLLDVLTYRYSGHSPSDAMTYRTKEEMEAFRKQDPIEAYGDYLLENKVVSKKELDQFGAILEEKIKKTLEITADPVLSPMVDEHFIESVMFSNGSVEKFDDREPVLLEKLEDNARVKQIARRSRYAYDENGKELPAAKQYQYRDAVFEAMAHRFSIDPTMVAYGEDHRDWGGAFACYRGLTELLPPSRFFNTPIAESAIVGSGVGYAMAGGRAVVELMYCDFLGCAGDEVFNQMPKWQAMSAGVLKMPLVLRVSVGNKYGAQHSQEWTSMVASVPGLKAMYPSTPYDVKGMLNYALRGTDPVVFFESQKLYGIGEMFVKEGVPEGYYEIPEGEPVIRREGKDVTLIALGPALYTATKAAEQLAEKGLEAEVIDLRWINPLKYELLIESVKKTGRAVFVTDSAERGSYMHTVSSNLSRLAFDYLDAPTIVVGSRNWITPPAEMEEYYFAQAYSVLDAIHEQILPIPDYVSKSNYTDGEFFRTSRLGV